MEKIKDFINKHIDWEFNMPLLSIFIVAILVVPCYMFLPEKYGYENGIIENTQMLVLLLCVAFACAADNYKKFFRILILFIIIFALREINCGRVFFPIPGEVNAFYHWEEIKYGFLVLPIYEAFIALSCILFLVTKTYDELFIMATKTKLPIWNILFFGIGAFGSWFADKHLNSYVFEEMIELLMYVSACSLIYIYAFYKDKKVDDELLK